MAQQGLGAIDHGHLGAEAVKDMGKLHGDIATAYHNEAFWLVVHAHDVFIGVVLHARVGIDLRNHRTGAGGNDDLVTADDMLAGLNGLRADKTGVLVVHGDIRGFFAAAVLFTALGNLIDAVGKDSVNDGIPIHAIDLSIKAQPAGLARRQGNIGGVDIHLGGNAAYVEAGPAEGALFNDGDFLVIKIWAWDGVSGASADDDEVEMFLGSGRVGLV